MSREARVGLSWLSAQKEGDCQWLTAFDGSTHPYLAFLWASFGDDNFCLIEFMRADVPKTLQVYLSNGSCERKDNCSYLEIKEEIEIAIRAKQVISFVEDYCDNCSLILVPQLEDNFSDAKARRIGAELERLTNGTEVKVYRNPLYSPRRKAPYDGIEYHNTIPELSPCIWSNDGIDVDIDGDTWSGETMSREEFEHLSRLYQHCKILLWVADGNCLTGDSGTALYPHQRQCWDTGYASLNEVLVR